MAKGYFIVHLKVSDDAGFQRYRTQMQGLIGRYSGRTIVGRRSRVRPVESIELFDQTFVIEFPNYEAAEAFYFSPEYQSALEHRLAAVTSFGVLAEGQEPVSG